MMTRILPREEWSRLDGPEFREALHKVEPFCAADPQVLVVEDGTDILGYLFLLPFWHAEGAWVDPAHRGKAAVFGQLLLGLGTAAQALGVKVVFPASDSESMRDIIMGLGGVEIAAQLFALNVTESRPCQFHS